MIEITPTNDAGSDNLLAPDTRHVVESFMAHLADVELPDISRVVLYGSRARGDHQPDSDVDIAMVLNGNDSDKVPRHKLQMRLSEVRSRAMIHADMPVSAIIVWESELREPEQQRNPEFFHNVLRDGIDLRVLQ